MPHIHDLYDFTASAYILHPTEPKICLHFHKKLNSWLQMGGHVELNEDPLMALKHELKEEVGFDEKDYEIIERTDQPKVEKYRYIPLPMTINVHQITDTHNHIDIVFLVRAKTTKLAPEKGESQQIGWYDQEGVQKLYDSGAMFQGVYETCRWLFENSID